MNETEWFQGRLLIDNAAMARCYWKRVVALLITALIVFLILWPANADAGPLFRATDGPAVITLYSEECQLKEVSNLKQRAVWVENGKTFEGCWGPTPFGFVVMYFSGDRTIGLAPNEAFKKVQGA